MWFEKETIRCQNHAMNNLPLGALRALAAVYEAGGVRSAARRLKVAHSSISRHLDELEGWLGVALIDRAAGVRFSLTAEGRELGQAVAKALGDITASVAAVRRERGGNTVTIGTTPSVAVRWLLPRLPQLQEACPWIEVSVSVERALRAPGGDGPDMNLRMGKGPWSGLRCDPLMDDEIFPVVSKHAATSLSGNEPSQDLAKMKLLHDNDPAVSWSEWKRRFGPAELDVRRGPRYSSSDLALRAAAHSMGVALARRCLAADDLETGVLVRVYDKESIVLPKSYWMVLPEDGARSSALNTVQEWLREEARSHQLSDQVPAAQ